VPENSFSPHRPSTPTIFDCDNLPSVCSRLLPQFELAEHLINYLFFFGGIWFDVRKYAVEVDSERILFVTLPPETDKNERDEL
jgi:hypothetical protein